MTTQNAHEYLPLIQALADGYPIQRMSHGRWVDYNGVIDLYNKPENYRVKPEPVKITLYLCVTPMDEYKVGDWHKSKPRRKDWLNFKAITVVEIEN